VHNPHYDFNDEALPIGAVLFARLVEKKLARSEVENALMI
jgi:metal-dependent amidase/aminoacylase/carboxypeptidase family protein